MREPVSKKYEHITRPYLFLLKEGKEIQENLLDYSLLLLLMDQPTVIPSPSNTLKVSTPLVHMLKK